MIYAGQLDSTLIFSHIVEVQSESGFKHTEEKEYLKCRAYRMKNKETYAVDAQEVFHISELTFQLRDRKEIMETDIVQYEGQRYRITSLDRYNRSELKIIVAKIKE